MEVSVTGVFWILSAWNANAFKYFNKLTMSYVLSCWLLIYSDFLKRPSLGLTQKPPDQAKGSGVRIAWLVTMKRPTVIHVTRGCNQGLQKCISRVTLSNPEAIYVCHVRSLPLHQMPTSSMLYLVKLYSSYWYYFHLFWHCVLPVKLPPKKLQIDAKCENFFFFWHKKCKWLKSAKRFKSVKLKAFTYC